MDSEILTTEVFELALSGDLRALRTVPKAERHSHILLAAPFEAYQELACGTLVPPPARYIGYDHFEKYLRKELVPVLRGIESIRKIFAAALNQMIADGVTYAEVSIDCMASGPNVEAWPETAAMFREELTRVQDLLDVRIDLGIAREMHGKDWRPRVAAAHATKLFSGIDLYGDEAAAGVEHFLWHYEKARELGLMTKLHCGEQHAPEIMLQELAAVAPMEVHHGIQAAHGAKALRSLRDRGISANVCPTSNIKLGLVPDYRVHPIRALFDAGINVTINTDDYALFGSSLSEEFLHLYRAKLFTAEELERIRIGSFRV